MKSVTPSEDKKSYTVAVFYEFNDAAEYEVTVKGYDAQTFVASKGAPKTIVLHSNKDNTSDRSVVVGQVNKIYTTLYDANNVNVTNDELLSKITYTIKYADSAYTRYENTLYFTAVGETAVVTAEYHSRAYDANGQEKDRADSAPHTFFAVAKGQELITGIQDYSTTGVYYNDYHEVKMSHEGTRFLEVKIRTKDYPYNDVVINAFDQVIMNHGNTVTFGTADFTSLNPDILEVYRGTNGKVGLNPRNVGTARVMVSYKNNVNGVLVSTPIGPVTIEVKAKSELASLALDSSFISVSAQPAGNDNTTAVENQEVAATIKDQYNADYTGYYLAGGEFTNGLKGNNDISKRALANGAISFTNVTKDGNTVKGLKIDNDKFLAIMNDMDGVNGADTQPTNIAVFNFTLAVQDNNTHAMKTAPFAVEARRPVDQDTSDADVDVDWKDVEFAVDMGRVEWAGFNVARFASDDNNFANECGKEVTLRVYQLNNGVRYDEVTIEGALPATDAGIKAATQGYYFQITRNGAPISQKGALDLNEAGKATAGNKVYYAFNHTGNTDLANTTKNIVKYDSNTEGAGSYEFILYRIDRVTKQVNGQDVTEGELRRITSRLINATCDAGKYSLVSRDAVTAKSTSQADLMACFTLADTTGTAMSKDSNDIGATIKFGNTTRDYKVVYNYENTGLVTGQKANSVFVDSIYVWEPVNITAWNDNTPLYVEYKVDVKCFVEIR